MQLIIKFVPRSPDATCAAKCRQDLSSTAVPETHVTGAGATAGSCHWAHLVVPSPVALNAQGLLETSDAISVYTLTLWAAAAHNGGGPEQRHTANMTERQAKTHFLEHTDLSSILEPERSSSRPAESKGMPLPL